MTVQRTIAEKIDLQRKGSFSASRDAMKHFAWDQRFFGTTISNATLFSQPIGAQWRNSGLKTINETNLIDTGKFPNGQIFNIEKIWVGLVLPIGAAATNGAQLVQSFYNIMQSSVFQIKLPGREWDFQAHGSMFLPQIAIANAPAATNNSDRYGDIVASGCLSMKEMPIVIDNLVQFSVQHIIENGDTNVVTVLNAGATLLNGVYGSMKVCLEGFLTRAK
jgi:hypothetical protein